MESHREPETMYNVRMGVEVIPRLTYEDFRQLPDDGKRYELIPGESALESGSKY
jgi:hypothetical protein